MADFDKVTRDLFKPDGGYTYAPGGFATTTFATGNTTVDLDALQTLMRQEIAKRDAIDAALLAGLRNLIAESERGLAAWAAKFGMSWLELADTLDGRRPVTGRFWDAVRAVFEPLCDGKVTRLPRGFFNG